MSSIVAKLLDGFKMPIVTELGLGSGDIVLNGGPAPPERGTEDPHFSAMSIVVKRSPISATAELLLINC